MYNIRTTYDKIPEIFKYFINNQEKIYYPDFICEPYYELLNHEVYIYINWNNVWNWAYASNIIHDHIILNRKTIPYKTFIRKNKLKRILND